jgi:outer membrane protein
VRLFNAKEEVLLMKRKQRYVISLFILALLALPVKSAFAFLGVEAGIGYWKQSPSGTLGYKPVTSTDELDLKNDLNLGDKNQVFFRAKVELPLVLPNIYFMATPMSFDGSNTITRSFTFGDQTFTGSTPVSSKLTLDHYDLALYYSIPGLKAVTLGILNIELGLDGRQINFDGTLSQGGVTSSKKSTFFIPMIYAGVQVKPISLLSIEAEFRGLSDGSDHYYDYIGRLKVMPFGPLFISGGYRAEELKLDKNDVKANVKFSGPFAEVGVTF